MSKYQTVHEDQDKSTQGRRSLPQFMGGGDKWCVCFNNCFFSKFRYINSQITEIVNYENRNAG